jgi:hypothetical protein
MPKILFANTENDAGEEIKAHITSCFKNGQRVGY